MKQGMGVILIDGLQIVTRIYLSSKEYQWKLIDYQSKDLGYIKRNVILETSDFIETISQVFLSEKGRHIADWKILARHLPGFIIKDVRLATNFEVEDLTLIREQELICLGALK